MSESHLDEYILDFNCIRGTLKILRSVIDPENLPLLIFVNKGIEVGTNALTLEIIADTWGPDVAKAATFIVSLYTPFSRTFSLDYLRQSGPSFAKESTYRNNIHVSFILSHSSCFEAANFCHRCFLYRGGSY